MIHLAPATNLNTLNNPKLNSNTLDEAIDLDQHVRKCKK